jgi:hypothetical protein
MAKPKLALIPAAQGSKFYSVLPSSGVGDFDFTRSSSATRINKDGLIETVADGVSRLNYPMIDGVVKGCPHHILEPQRSNLVKYSEDFSNSYWTKTPGNITSNAIISPNGTLSADLFTSTSDTTGYVQNNVSITVSGSKQTISLFVKKGSTNWCYLLLWDSVSNGAYQYFDIENGVIGNDETFGSGVTVDNANVEKYPNDWYRITATYNCSITNLIARISQTNGNLDPLSETNATIYIWGFQAESNSNYSTSYIPTTTAAVTRSAETANGSGDAATFNDSEGVLMAEISALTEDSGLSRRITISDGSTNNRVSIELDETEGLIKVFFTGNGTLNQLTKNISDVYTPFKILASYELNSLKLYINGYKITEDTSIVLPNGLDDLSFDSGTGSSNFYGNTKQLQYFDSALNDSDLEQLTSWVSFQDMAEGQTYSIK